MTAPIPNAALAYAVLDAIKVHRKAFDMGDWRDAPNDERVTLKELTQEKCGTSACFAGWAIAISGYNLGGGVTTPDGVHVSYSYGSFAEKLLGLNGDQAYDLFYGDGSDIEEAVAEIFGERPDQPYGSGCHCKFLGEGTPEHTPSALCRSLRPDAARDGDL